MTTDLHTKYRPQTWDEFLGNEALITSLRATVEKGTCHALIFTGPSGCGKTTLARIVASSVGCEKLNILEVDAATHTGVDAMRDICQGLNYVPFGNSKARALIVDEAHRLSAAAWSSLLKSIEEPPADTYWMFCTTEPEKIPNTIKTRCSEYRVNPVKRDELYDYLRDIAQVEGWEVSDDILDCILREAQGSTRQGLVYLSMVHEVKEVEQCLNLIQGVSEKKEVVELCRMLLTGKGLGWKNLMSLLKRLEDDEPERIRLAILGYMSKVAEGADSDKSAVRAIELMEIFSQAPFYMAGRSQLILSLGRVMFAE